MHNIKHKNKIAKGCLKKLWKINAIGKTIEYLFFQEQCKTELMEAVKSNGIFKRYFNKN